MHTQRTTLNKRLKRFMLMLISAFMLGMSNVILEEDRMLHDTQQKIELEQEQNADNKLA